MPTVNMSANMRSAVPLVLGSDEEHEAYLAEVAAMRSRLPAGRFAVAPRMTVRTIRGELQAGAEVTPADFRDVYDAEGRYLVLLGAARFALLVRDGVIVEGF